MFPFTSDIDISVLIDKQNHRLSVIKIPMDFKYNTIFNLFTLWCSLLLYEMQSTMSY
jgi:hypothetical protein